VSAWTRHRFVSDSEDYRPLVWPPAGPWWCSGWDSEDRAVIIAYVPSNEDLHTYWPEALNVDSEECEHITYSDRFPKPFWWEGE
jgi:hypothetical protein